MRYALIFATLGFASITLSYMRVIPPHVGIGVGGLFLIITFIAAAGSKGKW